MSNPMSGNRPYVRIARTWDDFDPVVYDDDQPISTRVLEKQFRDMKQALINMAHAPMDCNGYAKDVLDQIYGKGKW